MFNLPIAEANNPARKGQPASSSVAFGPHNRYAIVALHTRFDAVQWFVTDLTVSDPYHPHLAGVIRQEGTIEEALAGLPVEIINHGSKRYLVNVVDVAELAAAT